ncbi:hypothetical protein Tco_0875197 [Tanacetum coccineum]|uniref:Uncharacterized protein n=1 Tax=Tanacetum coccineum TaxID=301880 RepID=A0ABQ5BNS8_9ASTR
MRRNLSCSVGWTSFDDKLQFCRGTIEIQIVKSTVKSKAVVPLVKVRWILQERVQEFTWERKDQFRKKYPHLFLKTGAVVKLLRT